MWILCVWCLSYAILDIQRYSMKSVDGYDYHDVQKCTPCVYYKLKRVTTLNCPCSVCVCVFSPSILNDSVSNQRADSWNLHLTRKPSLKNDTQSEEIIVRRPGFKLFAVVYRSLGPRYQIPDRSCFTADCVLLPSKVYPEMRKWTSKDGEL